MQTGSIVGVNRNILIGLIWIILFCGCEHREKEKIYIDAIESTKGEARIVRQVGDYVLDMQYQPIEYRAFRELGIKPGETSFQQYIDERQGMEYFLLKISRKDGGDLAEIGGKGAEQQMIYYMSFGMQQDIYLETENNKKACDLYHFERSYDLKGGRSFVLGFDSAIGKDSEVTIVVDSDVLDTGPIKFHFDKKNIIQFEY